MLLIWFIVILIRIQTGKVSKKRWLEHFSISKDKPDKNLQTIWFHCVSIGEFKSLLKIIERLSKTNKYLILITTTTITSAKCVEDLNMKNVIHQFTPVESFLVINRFLKKWKPVKAVFCESEFWPLTIFLVSKFCKIYLINGNLSERSFKRWKFFQIFFKFFIASRFTAVYANGIDSLSRFLYFNCKNISKKYGSTKFDNSELILNQVKEDEEKINNFKKRNKNVFITFGSIHLSEIKEISKEIINVIKNINNAKVILYPRYINKEYIDLIKDEFKENKNNVYIVKEKDKQSILEELLNVEENIIIIPTLNMSLLFYSISEIVLIGGSFSFKTKGIHNSLEAVFLEKPTIIGENNLNAKFTIKTLESFNILKIVKNNSISEEIQYLLEDKSRINFLQEKIVNLKEHLKRNSISDIFLKEVFEIN